MYITIIIKGLRKIIRQISLNLGKVSKFRNSDQQKWDSKLLVSIVLLTNLYEVRVQLFLFISEIDMKFIITCVLTMKFNTYTYIRNNVKLFFLRSGVKRFTCNSCKGHD